MPRALIPAVLAAVLVAGGCGDADPTPVDADRDHRDHRAHRSSAAPATEAPSSPAKGPGRKIGKLGSAPLAMARPEGSRTHLLTADTLPTVGDTAWTVRSTRDEGSRRVGACQQTPLMDIGALHAVLRVFDGPEGSGLRGRQVVARLADAKSAWRTHEVLKSWRADCEERLDYPTTEVGPMEAVDLEGARGGRYSAAYGKKKDPDRAGLGIVRSGRWLSVVELTSTDGDLPDAWTRRAVRRIAATFG